MNPQLMSGGHPSNSMHQSTCAFPSPPVRSVYCEPAPFTRQCGSKYHKVIYAYGKSRPHHG